MKRVQSRFYYFVNFLLSMISLLMWLVPFRHQVTYSGIGSIPTTFLSELFKGMSIFEMSDYALSSFPKILVTGVFVLNVLTALYYLFRMIKPGLFKPTISGVCFLSIFNLMMIVVLIISNNQYFLSLNQNASSYPLNTLWYIYIIASMLMILFGIFKRISVKVNSKDL